MYVFLCHFETRNHFSKGVFSYKISATETANLVFVLLDNDQNIVSIIFHCESRVLSENSAQYDVTLYVTKF